MIGLPLSCLASDDWVLEKRFQEQMTQANNGDTQAMFEVGRMYERGRGIDEDVDAAIAWYQKASIGGSNLAHARLGMIYFSGQGARQDYKKAQTHLSVAAKHNIPAAQYYLGIMYEKGYAVKQDYSAALALYKKSAAGGYYQASARIAKVQKASKAKSARLPSPPTPTSRTSSSAKKLASSLVKSIMQGDWQRNGQPAGYLPSTGTKCKKIGTKNYKCRSEILSRKSNDTLITYVTMATLTGFSNKDQFNVTYRYNILRLQKDGPQETQEQDDDDGDYAAAPQQQYGTLRLGAQKTKHKLNCTLKEQRIVECIKNRTLKLEFNDRSGS